MICHKLQCITKDKYNLRTIFITSPSSHPHLGLKRPATQVAEIQSQNPSVFNLGTSHLLAQEKYQMALTGVLWAFAFVCITLCQAGKIYSVGGLSVRNLNHQDKLTWLETLQEKRVRSMVFCSPFLGFLKVRRY